jgi:xanthine/CO dehydrogenase XdhC/CoxF family maturation factor
MRELTDIAGAFEQLAAAATPAALATVAAVSGSSYRRPGARMLITGDGRSWGGVSGGCLERDVVRRARMLLTDDAQPIVCCYETGDDGDANLPGIAAIDGEDVIAAAEPGPSLGCGGQIEILIEPVTAQKPGPLPALIAAVRNRQSATIATIIRISGLSPSDQNIKPGQRLFRIDSSEVSGNLGDPLLHRAIVQQMNKPSAQSAGGLSRFPLSNGGWVDVLFENVRPPQALAIFGEGHDAAPLVDLAKLMGWHVTIIGNRAVAGLRQRFPSADVFICASSDDPTGGAVPLPFGAAAIVMSHNLRRDTAVTKALLKHPPAYFGILGPLRRTARLLASTGNSQSSLTPSVFAPVGLDIGAETSEQIALSVIGEIQAFLAGHGGGFLRDRPGPIHFRADGQPIPLGSISPNSAKDVLDSCGMD